MSGRATGGNRFASSVLDTWATMFVDPERTERAAAGLHRLEGRRRAVGDVLRLHKAVPQFQYGLDQLAAKGPEAHRARAAAAKSWYGAEAGQLADHLGLLSQELAWLAEQPEVAGADLAVIKGFNNARFYRDPSPRWSRDVDVYVPHWAACLAVVRLLRERGYVFDEEECPWFKAEFEHGRAEYGQLFLVRAEEGRFSRVDIHFGTYSVGAGEYLDFPLTDFYEPVAPDLGYQGVNPTGTLLVMFAHALSDGYVSVKDVNDTVSLALTRDDVDFGRLAREIRRHSLEPQALLLADHLTRLYRDPRIGGFAWALRRAAGGGRTSPLWRMHDRNWHRRAAVNAVHAYRSTLRRRRGPLVAARRAGQCAVFYNRRLSVTLNDRTLPQQLLVRLMARTDLTRWRLRSDACPTMIHTGHPALTGVAPDRLAAPDGSAVGLPRLRPTPAAGVRVGGTFPDRQLVAIGDDVFLCSWDQVVSHRDAALAKQLASVQGAGARRKGEPADD
ncbi:nucleotidyltransferase family protein [Streptomyces sp. NPDC049887]|uniref:nucleotidyltransferase family protein n=1 Tax=Streptomyces sp. NPDC049887 TaxID=3155654 RepID=UPI003430E80C